MKKFKTLALATAVSAGLLGSAGVMAAPVQGELGNYSEGKFDINLKIEPQVKISSLEDLDLKYTGNSPAFGLAQFCVHSSDTGSKYKIKASTTYDDGVEKSDKFALGNGSKSIELEVFFADDINADASSKKLDYDVFADDTSGWDGGILENCGGVDNASLYVRTTTGVASETTTFTGTMTLTVEPV